MNTTDRLQAAQVRLAEANAELAEARAAMLKAKAEERELQNQRDAAWFEEEEGAPLVFGLKRLRALDQIASWLCDAYDDGGKPRSLVFRSDNKWRLHDAGGAGIVAESHSLIDLASRAEALLRTKRLAELEKVMDLIEKERVEGDGPDAGLISHLVEAWRVFKGRGGEEA